MNTLFVSTGRSMEVHLDGDHMRCVVETDDDARADRIAELAQLEGSMEPGSFVMRPSIERRDGRTITLAVKTRRRPIASHTRFSGMPLWALLRSITLASEVAHPAGAYLGPFRRALLLSDPEFDALTPQMAFPLIQSQVHSWESRAMGVAGQMGDFFITPELRLDTLATDVFFTTYFLVELLTGREPFAGRTLDPLGYIQHVRNFEHRLDELAVHLPDREFVPLVLKAGLYPDPSTRFANLRELLDALHDVTRL